MNKNRKPIKIVVIALFAGGLIIFVGMKIRIGLNHIQESFDNDLPITYTIPSEDSTVISKKYWNQVKAVRIVNFKKRDPISILSFTDSYYLIINKIHINKETSIKRILHEKEGSTDRTTGEVYSIFDLGDSHQFQYRSLSTGIASGIFLTLDGDSPKCVMDDSVARYHFLCASLAIRYAESEAIDLYVTGKERLLGVKDRMSMDVLFLKRGTTVYFLLMAPMDSKASIPPDLLYNAMGL